MSIERFLSKLVKEASKLGLSQKISLEKGSYDAYLWVKSIDKSKIIIGYSDKFLLIDEKYYYLLARHELCHVLDILDKLYEIDIAAPDIEGIEIIARIGYKMYTDYMASKRYIKIYGMRIFKRYLNFLSKTAPREDSLKYTAYIIPTILGFKKYREAKKYFQDLSPQQWNILNKIKEIYETWNKKYSWNIISTKTIFLTLILKNLNTEKLAETIYLTSNILEEETIKHILTSLST